MNPKDESSGAENRMAKKENKMTPETSQPEGLTKNPEIIAQVLKQKQKVMDLETGDESAEIELVMTKYVAPEYDVKVYGGTEELFNSAVFAAASALIQPITEQTKAFLSKATSDSYQSAKAAALAKGNFLGADLKGRIVQVMRGNAAFVEMSAKDAFDYWKAGYKAQKPGAIKVLDTAKALGDFEF